MTALGLVVGATFGVILFALYGDFWWLGLAALGLVLGAAVDLNLGRKSE